jgi:hypothetical protein
LGAAEAVLVVEVRAFETAEPGDVGVDAAFSSTSGSPVASALISAKERAWSPMSSTSRSDRSPRVNWAMKADFRSSVCLLRTSLAPRAWNLSGGPIDGVVSAAR